MNAGAEGMTTGAAVAVGLASRAAMRASSALSLRSVLVWANPKQQPFIAMKATRAERSAGSIFYSVGRIVGVAGAMKVKFG